MKGRILKHQLDQMLVKAGYRCSSTT